MRDNRFGKALAIVGVSVVLLEVLLHFASWYMERDYEMNHFVVAIGAVMGFWGFWKMDPKGTKDGAAVLKDLIPTFPLRFGRRKSDAVAIPEAVTEITAKPVPEKPDGQSGQ